MSYPAALLFQLHFLPAIELFSQSSLQNCDPMFLAISLPLIISSIILPLRPSFMEFLFPTVTWVIQKISSNHNLALAPPPPPPSTLWDPFLFYSFRTTQCSVVRHILCLEILLLLNQKFERARKVKDAHTLATVATKILMKHMSRFNKEDL